MCEGVTLTVVSTNDPYQTEAVFDNLQTQTTRRYIIKGLDEYETGPDGVKRAVVPTINFIGKISRRCSGWDDKDFEYKNTLIARINLEMNEDGQE